MRYICTDIYLSIYLSIYPSICLSIYLSTYLPTYVSIYRSIYLSIHTYRTTHIYVYIYIGHLHFLPPNAPRPPARCHLESQGRRVRPDLAHRGPVPRVLGEEGDPDVLRGHGEIMDGMQLRLNVHLGCSYTWPDPAHGGPGLRVLGEERDPDVLRGHRVRRDNEWDSTFLYGNDREFGVALFFLAAAAASPIQPHSFPTYLNVHFRTSCMFLVSAT